MLWAYTPYLRLRTMLSISLRTMTVPAICFGRHVYSPRAPAPLRSAQY